MSNSPPASTPSGSSTSEPDESLRRLRAEFDTAVDAARRSKLLAEMAEIEERSGDDSAAARDYLAAYEVDPTFREPLEGVARLLQRRSSLKGLEARVTDSLVAAAATPDERVRALVAQALQRADGGNDPESAAGVMAEATQERGASAAEQSRAWLETEVLAGRLGRVDARQEALAERLRFATNPAWHALLLVDRARMAAHTELAGSAVAWLEQALASGTASTWIAASALDRLTQDRAGLAVALEPGARDELRARALESIAELVELAMSDPSRGDALGVPQWAREPGRAIDAWLRAVDLRRGLGQLEPVARLLERARAVADRATGDDARLMQAAVANAGIRLAEQTADTAVAAQLAAKRLETEKDKSLAAALGLRIAEHAASSGDVNGAVEALSRALDSDPSCLPARALLLDVMADVGSPAAFASRLETFADDLATDGARARTYLLSAYVWAARAGDTGAAKAAIAQAAMFGASAETAARVARMLASLAGDAAWYEEATKRLLAAGAGDKEALSLRAELVRARALRGDGPALEKAVRELADTPGGTWLANVLEAFAPALPSTARNLDGDAARSRSAIEALAEDEPDAEQANELRMIAALRAHASGDIGAARRHLQHGANRQPDDVIAAVYLADLHRIAGDHAAAARAAAKVGASTDDPELGAAFHLEAALESVRGGDPLGALDFIEAATRTAPEAGRALLRWAGWGVDPESLDSRRRAIRHAENSGADARALALERFAVEVAAGDAAAADAALSTLDAAPAGSLNLAAALGRVAWSSPASSASAMNDALARIASRGPGALLLASQERARAARESGKPEAAASAARTWFEAGGALPASLEWLAAAMGTNDSREEARARLAVAESLSGDARDLMHVSAALLQAHVDPNGPTALIGGTSPAVRLANLELAPPGCDPRRRATVLDELDGAVDDDARVDATALSGWSSLAASDVAAARAAFEKVTAARPGDLAAWEGLRACAEAAGDVVLRAKACEELGGRCSDPRRGAEFWEIAAFLYLDLGDEDGADRALDASFARDPTRPDTFDKLFRRTRERKKNDKLLSIIGQRLQVTDDPNEIIKLFWEQARVLREGGDYEGALRALEHVTILDPDHVGALALLGEINIRRSQFEDAAAALARLATLPTAPPKSRLTAGVAAADLYENKLRRADSALEVLLCLRDAKLSTVPVRERLARVAGRTGAWDVATSTLEELMSERSAPEGRVEAARLAIAIHRDRLGKLDGAARAVAKLLSELPADGEGIDLLLQSAQPAEAKGPMLRATRDALLARLQQHVDQGQIADVRRLAAVAKAIADPALQQAALGVLLALGESDAETDHTFAQLAAKKSRVPHVSISDATLKAVLAPGDDGPLADLFGLLGPTLAKALGPNAQVCGVGKRDRVDPRSGLALRNEIASWAGALRIGEFDLYVGGKDPLGVQGIPGEPPALVVGAGVNAPLSPLTRARVARELLGIVRGTTIVRWRDEMTVAAVVVVACHLAGESIQHPPYAVLDEVEKLVSKAISGKTRKQISPLCAQIARGRLDAREWSRRAAASQDRMAIVASGAPGVVIGDVLGVAAERVGASISGSDRAIDLLRFVLSPSYVASRQFLGLEGAA